jgi:PilZ domain
MSDSLPGPRIERRRHPRTRPRDETWLSFPNVVATEVLDIGPGGALLSTAASLKVGQRARLRLLLGRDPFSGWVEARWVHSGTQTGNTHRFRIGTSFSGLDEPNRRTLQRFLRDDSDPL